METAHPGRVGSSSRLRSGGGSLGWDRLQVGWFRHLSGSEMRSDVEVESSDEAPATLGGSVTRGLGQLVESGVISGR